MSGARRSREHFKSEHSWEAVAADTLRAYNRVLGRWFLQPLVSILVPAYNAEGTIALTLTSAVRLTVERQKRLSSSMTARATRPGRSPRRSRGRRARGVAENQGASAASNEALSLSRGDYVQWLDADDLLSPNKIAAQLGGVS